MWFYKILLGFYWVSPSFTEFYWILPGFTWFQWVHLLLMGFYWIRNPFSFAWKRFYRVFSCDWLRPSLPSAVPGWFIDNSLIKVIYFSSVSLGWYQIIVVFYWVFPEFDSFDLNWLGPCTGFGWSLLGFCCVWLIRARWCWRFAMAQSADYVDRPVE